MVEVFRKADRAIIVKIMLENKVFNIVKTYGPQLLWYEERQKEDFWQEMNVVMQENSGSEDIVIVHMGKDRIYYDRIHEGRTYIWKKNKTEEGVIDFVLMYELN